MTPSPNPPQPEPPVSEEAWKAWNDAMSVYRDLYSEIRQEGDSIKGDTQAILVIQRAITTALARQAQEHEAIFNELRQEAQKHEIDSLYIDLLERRGVQSIYFNDQSQINPASMSLRACLELELQQLANRIFEKPAARAQPKETQE